MWASRIGIAVCVALFAATGCAEKPREAARPRAETFVFDLLSLHDLNGTSPSARSDAARRKPVDRAALARLFADYEKEDPFLADLYVGFIVGSLATHQERLQIFESGARAEIRAGNTTVSLRYGNGAWRASLAASIPEAIKAK